nr:ABC transporter E family member 2 [Ipomoea batatas]
MSDQRLTRIAIVSSDKCKPKKCRQECKKSCPVVKTGNSPNFCTALRWESTFHQKDHGNLLGEDCTFRNSSRVVGTDESEPFHGIRGRFARAYLLGLPTVIDEKELEAALRYFFVLITLEKMEEERSTLINKDKGLFSNLRPVCSWDIIFNYGAYSPFHRPGVYPPGAYPPQPGTYPPQHGLTLHSMGISSPRISTSRLSSPRIYTSRLSSQEGHGSGLMGPMLASAAAACGTLVMVLVICYMDLSQSLAHRRCFITDMLVIMVMQASKHGEGHGPYGHFVMASSRPWEAWCSDAWRS